jgi:flagellar hook-basal body complex protein FliE
MVNGANNLSSLTRVAGGSSSIAKPASSESAGGASFADALKNSIDEVSRLQQDASKAVEDLATGKSEDVSGVMTAMEKSDLAFKTLLAIRSKLMDAYEEIKSIQV